MLLAAGHAIAPGDLRLSHLPAATTADTLEDALHALVLKWLGRGEPALFERVTHLLVRAAFEFAGENQV